MLGEWGGEELTQEVLAFAALAVVVLHEAGLQTGLVLRRAGVEDAAQYFVSHRFFRLRE